MKKSIFIGALALITLAACQNESNELQNEVQKTEEAQRRAGSNANEADLLNSVKRASGYDSRRTPYIVCHTDWTALQGTSCVINGDGIYQVTWTNGFEINSNGQTVPATIYTPTKVTSCGC
ncbi:hypothetical protein [Chryseobacterium sp. ON_d1]|uniref:hypothetical protein n=1 Tax=Chryseobacterium sp. ON_d1 TaxID=2583211 RepID=UPI00115B3E62|nr:hypothetical protein [Chryseobacterium sp. ON_d1]GEJ46042.1 hypothetical protein CRS_26500 [Chryseobacterium sp. ON_d1]